MLTWNVVKSNVLGSSPAYTCLLPEQMIVMMGEDGGDENGVKKYWGTWEELILGAAVLRLGTKDWNAVASLLQSKMTYPSLFTCEDCKTKYEELQQRYSGCNAWFEELRKKRVAELKNALAESETSIGSLESKIELLKAEKTWSNAAADCSSSRGDESELSPLQFCNKSDAISEYSGKDVPNKDGLSAGSYTEEAGPKWSSSPNSFRGDVSEDNKTGILPLALETKASSNGECFAQKDRFTVGARSDHRMVVMRKKRTQNKRKRRIWKANDQTDTEVENHCSSLGNVGGNDNISQEMDMMKVGGCCSATGAGSVKESGGNEDLAEVFKSIMENDQASIFQRKMDSQKRARYKQVVRQHIDLEMIKSRIMSKGILTIGELLRDLLLLANNALVFYSKTTREYKCALVLRDLVNKKLRTGIKLSFLRSSVEHSHPHYAKLPAARHDNKPVVHHDDKLLAKPRNGHHPNKAVSNKAAASFAGVPAALATATMIATTKGAVNITNKVNNMDRNGRSESAVSMDSSPVKLKRQKGRPPMQVKKDRVSALAAVAAGTITKSSYAIKPRKRPRAALN